MPERPAHRLRDERGSTVPGPAPSHRGCTPRYGRGRSARLLRSTAARLPESALQMNPNYLDFEQPIADLEAKIQDLRQASTGPAVNIDAELHALRDKLRLRTAQIFRDLSPWQVSQLARHPARQIGRSDERRVGNECVST